jgi:long-chain acyl-CoA synthetase
LSYGGRLTNEIIKQFEDIYHSRVLEAYGLTEAGPLVAANRIDLDRKTNAVGLPLVGVDVQIRDENRCPLMPNENGEIWVKSAGIMRGYYNKPDETRKRIVDGWLFTGDIGFLDMDHYLYVLDRKEDIISKAGFNIFPTEVEDVLLKHPAVLEVAIVGVPDPVHSLEVKAFVVLKSNMKVEEEQLVEFCKQSLPVYKVPKYVQFCTSLPKSPTGRILKRLLRNIELSKEQS